MAAIVLLEPDSVAARCIDRLTGRRGYSHALVDPGWDRVPHTVIDVTLEGGVHFSTWGQAVGSRAHLRVELERLAGVRLVDELVALVGQPFDLTSMIGVLSGDANLCRGIYCSGVIAACLPLDLRARLPPCVAPSDLLALEQVSIGRCACSGSR